MPRLDYSDTPDTQEFTPLPAGEYLVAVDNIDERTTKSGDEMWNVRYKVVEGDHTGRFVFDNIVFSEPAKGRCKLIFKRLGFNVERPFTVEPDALYGKSVYITVEDNEYVTNSGIHRKNNKVPFDGYRSADQETKPELDMPDEEFPF